MLKDIVWMRCDNDKLKISKRDFFNPHNKNSEKKEKYLFK